MTLYDMELFIRNGIDILTYPEPKGLKAGGFSMGQICPVLAMDHVKHVQVHT